jgi:hypothetical protein
MGIQGGRRNQPLRTRHPDPDFVSVKIKGFTGQINIQGRFIGRQTKNYAGTGQELKQAVADIPASNQGQPHILRLMKFRQASTDCGKQGVSVIHRDHLTREMKLQINYHIHFSVPLEV